MQYPAIKSLPGWICEDMGASLKKEEPISQLPTAKARGLVPNKDR